MSKDESQKQKSKDTAIAVALITVLGSILVTFLTIYKDQLAPVFFRTPVPTITVPITNVPVTNEVSLTPPPVDPGSTQSLRDPEAFVRYYFETLTQNRDYELAWSLLTPSFQNRNSPEGYDSYVSLWQNIEKVTINSINFYENTETSARCDANITYFLINGNTETYDVKYHLVFDHSRQTWLFESP